LVDISDPLLFLWRGFFVRYLEGFYLFNDMSEAKAQAEAFRDGFLQSIGESYDKIDPTEYPVAEQMFLYYGKMFNDAVAKNLKKSGSIGSGKIAELALPVVNKFGNNYEMYLGYKKDNPASVYYKFVNKGVKGFGGLNAKPKKVKSDTPYQYKTPYPNEKMAKSIMQWMKLGKAKARTDTQKKNLTAEQTKNKRLKNVTPKPLTLMQISYMVAAAIKRDGLKTTSFFDNAIKSVFNKDFYAAMATAFGGDVQIQIRQIGNKMENNGYNNK
jgi:hypothetical protein